jgi:hypothetical protein
MIVEGALEDSKRGTVTDTSQGEGWWLASDGKWYPPESAAHAAPPPPPHHIGSLSAQPVSVAARVMIGASALVALGSLLPWATATEPFGSISKAGTSGDGVLTLIFAAAAILCGLSCLRGQPDRRKAAVVGTVLLGLSAAISVYDMSTLPIPSSHLVVVSVGIGLWLCAIGSIVGTAAGTIAIRTCTQHRTSQAEVLGHGLQLGQ